MAESDDITATATTSPTKEKEVLTTTADVKKDAVEEEKPKKKVIQKITLESVPDAAKIAKRKERFGIPDQETVEVKKSKRAQRFGSSGGGAVIPTTPEIEAKKKARAARFSNGGPPEIEEKKRARSARFGNATN